MTPDIDVWLCRNRRGIDARKRTLPRGDMRPEREKLRFRRIQNYLADHGLVAVEEGD